MHGSILVIQPIICTALKLTSFPGPNANKTNFLIDTESAKAPAESRSLQEKFRDSEYFEKLPGRYVLPRNLTCLQVNKQPTKSSIMFFFGFWKAYLQNLMMICVFIHPLLLFSNILVIWMYVLDIYG